ncbi:DUF6193 family natural product biosynthesis protein [Kitasatospora sp. NPDC004272]
MTEQPATEQPVTERPVTERPVTERPVTERPVTERPVTEQPADGYARHYPDLVRAGSLRAALGAALPEDTPDRYPGSVRAEAGERSVSVTTAEGERAFRVQCSVRWVPMAAGRTDDLAAVAGAAAHWLRAVPVRELTGRWPFLGTSELAEAYERGDPVPARWAGLRAARPRPRYAAELRAFIEAAHAEPRLRALSPGMSMFWLTFSRRAEHPVCHDLPMVRALGGDRYEIRHGEGRREVREEDGVPDTLAAVLALLPADAVPEPCLPMI